MDQKSISDTANGDTIKLLLGYGYTLEGWKATAIIFELIDESESQIKLTVHSKFGYGWLEVSDFPLEPMAKFMFTQFVFVLSVKLFILNVPPLQNDPNGIEEEPHDVDVPIPYSLFEFELAYPG